MHEYEGLFGELIGMVFIILSLTIPIVYMVLRSRRLHRAMELLHSERMAAIERGMELPASSLELVADQAAQLKRPRTALLPGLVWLFVGIAISFARSFDGHDAPLLIGLIPAGIGLAYLIYYFVEERNQLAKESEADAKAQSTL